MKYLLTNLLLILFFTACTNKQESVKLEAGTPAYELAQKISERVPYMTPDANNTIISCNSFDITSGDVIDYWQRFFSNRLRDLDSLGERKLRDDIVSTARSLAHRKLYENAAVKAGITTSQTEIDSVIHLFMEKAGGKEQYEKRLADAGQSADDILDIVRMNLIGTKYIRQAIADCTIVTEHEILQKYQEIKYVNVRHIFMSTENKSDEEKRIVYDKMQGILARAKQGEDFAELAKQYSEEKDTAKEGGLLTGVHRGKADPAFEEAAYNILPGNISPIVETRTGYHIIKVIRRYKETRPLQTFRKPYTDELRKIKERKARKALIQRLKDEENYTEIQFWKKARPNEPTN